MRACLYVASKQLKNKLRLQVKRPQFWIITLIVIAYFVLYFYQEINHIGESGVIDNALTIFQGGATLVFLCFAFFGMSVGLKRGNSFFRPADINNLFVSPVRPAQILLYGVMKQFSTSILATFILLMQLTNLRFYFGLGLREMLILMAAWLLLSFSVALISITIYSITANHLLMRRASIVSIYTFGIGLLAVAVYTLWRSGASFSNIWTYLNYPELHQIPLGGWTAGFLVNALHGRYKIAAMYAALTLLLPLVGVVIVSRNGSDYYEDVIDSSGNLYGESTEESEQWRTRAVKSSHSTQQYSRLLGFRTGEAVFLQRQLTEQQRSLAVLFDRGSLGMLALSVLLGAVLHSLMRKGMYPFIMEIIAVAVLCYGLFFTMPMGRFVEELRKHFIYLLPGTPLKKLFYASCAPVLKAFVESMLCFAVVSFLAQLDPIFIFCGALYYASASLLFSAAYLASVRVIGLTSSKNTHMSLAFVIISAVFIFELSLGATIGKRLYAMSPDLFLFDFVILAVFNFLASLVFFNGAKSILEYRD
ncbi:MAG: putative ABC exporter domain-containing protein [Clostridiales bacterium]|nr:putative ABC exporter domain-containing protein [Clostridiales bacterium]